MTLFQYYPQELIEKPESPIVYAIYMNEIQEIAEGCLDRELTEDELKVLPYAFRQTDEITYWAEVVDIAVGIANGGPQCDECTADESPHTSDDCISA